MLNIKVVKSRKWAFALSAILLLIGIAFVFINGFSTGVDFSSGLSIDIKIDGDSNVSIEEMRTTLSSVPNVSVVRLGSTADNTFTLKAKAADESERAEVESSIKSALLAKYSEDEIKTLSSSFIGARFSSSLITTSIWAILIALVCILIYIWFRFQLSFSIASILVLLHDVFLLLSFIVIFKIEISSLTIAAILTIIGYTLNNTIVIFDRIRENIKFSELKDLDSIIDLSVSQSFTRTLFSSLTTLATIIPIGIIVSNREIKMFALVLTVGISIGIYSSTFISANILRFLSLTKKKILNPMTITAK